MPRDLDDALAAELAAAELRPVFFFEMETTVDGLYVRAWTGAGTFRWNGLDWAGIGTFGRIAAIEETSELRAAGRSYELQEVDPALIQESLSYMRQGKAVSLWLGALEPERPVLIGEPKLLDSGRLDMVEIADDALTCTIKIAVESRLIDLERPRAIRYTAGAQVEIDPTDEGFAYVAPLQDAEVAWGQA